MIVKKDGMAWRGLRNWFAPHCASVDVLKIRRQIASIISSPTMPSSVAVHDCGDEMYVDDRHVSIHWCSRLERSDDGTGNNQKA